LSSASRLKLCGAIFDAPNKKTQVDKLEVQISAPDFWSQPEKSQKILQDRKRLDEAIQHDRKIAGLTSDLDTLFDWSTRGRSRVVFHPVSASTGDGSESR